MDGRASGNSCFKRVAVKRLSRALLVSVYSEVKQHVTDESCGIRMNSVTAAQGGRAKKLRGRGEVALTEICIEEVLKTKNRKERDDRKCTSFASSLALSLYAHFRSLSVASSSLMLSFPSLYRCLFSVSNFPEATFFALPSYYIHITRPDEVILDMQIHNQIDR